MSGPAEGLGCHVAGGKKLFLRNDPPDTFKHPRSGFERGTGAGQPGKGRWNILKGLRPGAESPVMAVPSVLGNPVAGSELAARGPIGQAGVPNMPATFGCACHAQSKVESEIPAQSVFAPDLHRGRDRLSDPSGPEAPPEPVGIPAAPATSVGSRSGVPRLVRLAIRCLLLFRQ